MTSAKGILLACTQLALLTGCIQHSNQTEATKAAIQWSEAYFGYDYHEAERFCTPESGKWLRFAASNASQDDVDLMGDQTIEVTAIRESADDTLRFVTLQVSHFVRPGTVGEPSSLGSDGQYQLVMVKRNGQWLVKLNGLPRP